MTLGSEISSRDGRSSSIAPPQIELGLIGYFVCNEFGHVAKNYPQRVFLPIPMLIVRDGSHSGRDSVRGSRGRGKNICDGGRRVIQFESKCGQFYDIPIRLEAEDSNIIIIGIIQIFF